MKGEVVMIVRCKGVLLAALALGAAAIATPATAATEVVVASCDSLTDGDSAGCLFNGNVNGSNNGNNSYLLAEAAYNALAFPDIDLVYLTGTDDLDFSNFGSFTGQGQTSGTFSLPGFDIDYFAVKSGNQFILYEYLGANSFTTAGLTNKKGELQGLSHLAFFGTEARSAVPEPGTWMMMLLGFGAVGSAMRRNRKANGGVLQTT